MSVSNELTSSALELLKMSVLPAVRAERQSRALREIEEIRTAVTTDEIDAIESMVQREEFQRAAGAIEVLAAGTFYELDVSDL